ncbi:MAG TPA: class I SAM-dependent methyltransferase [Bacteroidia bacterium]|nr:class I SAM-dependent methyltransferase [Bacteroidia bacterium]
MKTTERFSDRVENYVKYRPAYPVGVLEHLRDAKVLAQNSVVADIGSGTGISSKLFLDNGNEVFGVEPNKEMREAAEEYLKNEKSFHSVDGTAEETNLKNNSIDIVLAGQAFHWFDAEKAKREFKRILRPDGNVVLMWNDRRTDSTDFLRAYEDLLKMFGTDYGKVNHKNIDEKNFDAFWGTGNWKSFSVENYQDFTFEGLKGRLFSSSYVPAENHPDSAFMVSVLKKIFTRYQENGTVRFEYDTIVYYGKLS